MYVSLNDFPQVTSLSCLATLVNISLLSGIYGHGKIDTEDFVSISQTESRIMNDFVDKMRSP